MARENDLEGPQDMGGKHGGQAGQPQPSSRPRVHPSDDDVVAKRHSGQTNKQAAPTKKD